MLLLLNLSIYLVGGTFSSDFPTENALELTFLSTNGSGDVFVTKISINQAPSSSPSLLSQINIFYLLSGIVFVALIGISYEIGKKWKS